MGRDTIDLPYDVHDDGESFDDMDDDEFFLMDCSMRPDGQCGQAGSEFCDFECPVMRDVRSQERRKRKEGA